MPAQAEIINLNDTTPAPPTGQQNVHWQKGATTGNDPATGYPIFPTSANMPAMVGDSGSGGTGGAVPAPGVGDAAAGKFLQANGTWTVPPSTVEPANTVLAGPTSGASAVPTFRAVVEADLALTDITTNNVSASKHGFTPKLPNDATKYLNGTGGFTVPPGTTTGAPTTSDYIIGATDATLTNAHVWPALYNHPDIPPTSPGTLDDEFDAGTLAGSWSWVNQGSVTASFSNGYLQMAIAASNAGADNIAMIVKTAPSTPWEVTCKVYMVSYNQNWLGGGIILRESSTGKLIMFGPAFYSSRGLDVSTWNSTGSNASDSTGGPLHYGAHYLRCRDNGTNLIFSWSPDGISYSQYDSRSRTAFLASGPNQVGLGYNTHVPIGGGGPVAMDVDFFRRTL